MENDHIAVPEFDISVLNDVNANKYSNIIGQVDKDWEEFAINATIEEIETYAPYADWYFIIKNRKLEETFIEQFVNYFDYHAWYALACFQELSLDFIQKHKDKLPMYWVCKYRKLSAEFINSNIELFTEESIYNIIKYQEIHQELKDQLNISRLNGYRIAL
jgi:hypothetical protein